MNYSKETIQFAKDLVSYYSKFDKYAQAYTIRLYDIPDFDIHAFATFLMIDDESLGAEAISKDNPSYEKTMYPALLRFMKNTTDKDEEIEFTKAWRDGVASYFNKIMTEILDDICRDRTSDEFNDAGLYARNDKNGEIYWSR